MRPRFLTPALVLVCALCAAVAPSAAHAAPNVAIDCNVSKTQGEGTGFQRVLWSDPAPASSSVSWERWQGAGATMLIRNRSVNEWCYGFQTGGGVMLKIVDSANHITNGFFDVGWMEDNGCPSSGSGSGCTQKGWILYTDYEHPDGTIEDRTCGTGCWGLSGAGQAEENGTPCTFRIQAMPSGSGDDWEALINCGEGWYTIGVYKNTGYTHGAPVAESWRLGGTPDGMSEEFDSLREYQWSSNSWIAFDNVACYADTASNWFGHKLSADSFEVLQGSSSC
jgi:hypothetical protein